MKPVRVNIEVPYPRDRVYDFLDVMSNHERFTNHMLQDWKYSGAERGIGSKATVTVKAAGRSEEVDFEVVAAERPSTIVEQNVGAAGRRIATGTYTLEELPSGGTGITFEYAWKQAPLGERVAAPLVRAYLARGNRRAMARLADELAVSLAPARTSQDPAAQRRTSAPLGAQSAAPLPPAGRTSHVRRTQ